MPTFFGGGFYETNGLTTAVTTNCANIYAQATGIYTNAATMADIWPTWVHTANQFTLRNVWLRWNDDTAAPVGPLHGLGTQTVPEGVLLQQQIVQGQANPTTGVTIVNQVWCQWNERVELTKEQREANERERARYAEANRIAAEAMSKAKDRARKLLVANLPAEQRDQLEKHQYFDIIAHGSRRRYRIHQGTHGNVRLLSPSGKEVMRYCGQPNGVPTEDAMLAQALQIMHDEDAFLKKANATALGTAGEIREAQTAVVLPRVAVA